MRPALGAIGCALVVVAASGCSEKSEPDPKSLTAAPAELVAEAAGRTWAQRTTTLELRVSARAKAWSGHGLIELEPGRFRVVAAAAGGREQASLPTTVIGTAGEGFENTVSESRGFYVSPRPDDPRCWMNPHAPVGFYAAPMSVEESVRLTGAIVESLRREIAGAEELAAERFRVELRPTAALPRDDFKDRPYRVWGDRWLIARMTSPVTVTVGAGGIETLSFELRYSPEPHGLWADRAPRTVAVEAATAATQRRLVIDRPSCGAME